MDLGESFPTSIYLQNLASIQPRTSLVKFARSPRTDPPGGTTEAERRASRLDAHEAAARTVARTANSNNRRSTFRRSRLYYGETVGAPTFSDIPATFGGNFR